MTKEEYAEEAMKMRKPQSEDLIYTTVALCGEAGEFANGMKKMMHDDLGKMTDTRRQYLILELGDVLWYLTSAADLLGVSLDAIMEQNIKKLRARRAGPVATGGVS